MLDLDLANVYGVATKVLNQAVKRNKDKFPPDFSFQLTKNEAVTILRSRSQTVTLKRGKNIKYVPNVFTEHGAIMAANVLHSSRAVLAKKLSALEKELKGRLNVHESAIVSILQRVMDIIAPPPLPVPKSRRIGFGGRHD